MKMITCKHNNKFLASLLSVATCVAVLFTACNGAMADEKPMSSAESEILGPADPDTVAPLEDRSVYFETADDAIAYMKDSGHWQEYSRGILPQMAKDELDYANKLLNNEFDGFVVVDKSRMKVIKFNRYGDAEATFGMACAKNYGTKHHHADWRTPEGFFSVKKIHNSENWHYVDDNGVESPKTGEFGPRFIRLAIPSTNQIGIHGTSAPWSIGGRRSHGCIRLSNENIMKLVKMVEIGMPVIITPGSKDMAVNEEEGYHIPSISTVPGQAHLVPHKATAHHHHSHS